MKWLDFTDPKFQTYFAVFMAIIAAIGSGSLSLPLGIPVDWAAMIKSWDNFIVGAWLIAVPIMFGTSKGPGPWTKQ